MGRKSGRLRMNPKVTNCMCSHRLSVPNDGCMKPFCGRPAHGNNSPRFARMGLQGCPCRKHSYSPGLHPLCFQVPTRGNLIFIISNPPSVSAQRHSIGPPVALILSQVGLMVDLPKGKSARSISSRMYVGQSDCAHRETAAAVVGAGTKNDGLQGTKKRLTGMSVSLRMLRQRNHGRRRQKSTIFAPLTDAWAQM